MKLKLAAWFVLTQALACGFVFRDALWGRTLLAPLDIPPALFSKYRFVDPSSTEVPANHHIIDQVTYDVPLQWTIYEAWHHGETPWWNPYDHGGRPLLADAHVNGADPVRWVMYRLLPFEMAYNWTLILHYVLHGLGMLLLLRRLGVDDMHALLLALAYQFSGAFVVFFVHPWIQSTFVYYPFLWLAWLTALEGRREAVALAAVLVGAIFYTGNVQSHPYLAAFAICFGLGSAGLDWRRWLRVLPVLGGSGVLGALLAAPMLAIELELFVLNVRPIDAVFDWRSSLSAVASSVVFYPWAFGTFKTLDLSKFFGHSWHLGFLLFIGCAAFWLAVLGALPGRWTGLRALTRRIALWLIAFYLLVISTPLHLYLYPRCALLAVMGMTVLAALGLARLRESTVPVRRLGRVVLALAVATAIVTNVFAFAVYPRLIPKVEQFVAKQSAHSRRFEEAKPLRAAQIQRLPSEISFRNPEAVFGFLGMIAVGSVLLLPSLRQAPAVWLGLLVLNLLPSLMFDARFVPRHPVVLWHRLQEGGPEQQRVMEKLADKPLRLDESAPGLFDRLFPGSLAVLYRVQTVGGYSALHPSSVAEITGEAQGRWRHLIADWTYQSASRGVALGEFFSNGHAALARFQWAQPSSRAFVVAPKGLNRLDVNFEIGPGGVWVWGDTRYPGWSARIDGMTVPLQAFGPCFNAVEIPASARRLELEYRPRLLAPTKAIAALGAVGVIALAASGVLRTRPARSGVIRD